MGFGLVNRRSDLGGVVVYNLVTLKLYHYPAPIGARALRKSLVAMR